MDLKTVQQQLKASISKHQDQKLGGALQEIQKHIARLGTMQKNLAKPKEKKETGFQDLDINGSARKEQDTSGSASSTGRFLKLDPQLKSTNEIERFLVVGSPTNASKTFLKGTLRNLSVQSTTNDVNTCSNTEKSAKSAKMSEQTPGSDNEPLNLTSSSKAKSVKNSFPVKLNHDKERSSKVLVHSPVQIKLQVPTTSSVKATSSAVIKPMPSNSTLRIPNGKRAAETSQPVATHSQIVFSVAPTSSGQPSLRKSTTTSRCGANSTKQIGTFQKFRIVGAKISGFNKPGASRVNASSPTALTSPATKAYGTSGKQLTSLPKSTASSSTDSNEALSGGISTDSKDGVGKTARDPVRPYSIFPDHVSKKVSFLGNVDLVPIEKAEKMRSRRYGRRRAVAHPVYSGGLYVSTAAADSSRRLIPSELLDIGLETIPAKRPRGRPRGSTNKRSFSPVEATSGVDEEYFRILQEAKPSEIPTIEQNKPEDVCEVCKKPGEFLMCDTCSLLYHMNCLTPPLHEVPNGMWCCSKCKVKINDPTSASEWPGLLSVVQSFFAFNSKREVALESHREKSRNLKAKKHKLAEQKKHLAGILKEKLCNKSKQAAIEQRYMEECDNLTSLFERIRCAVNRTLENS